MNKYDVINQRIKDDKRVVINAHDDSYSIDMDVIDELYHIDYEVICDIESYFTLEELFDIVSDKINVLLDKMDEKKSEAYTYLSLREAIIHSSSLANAIVEGKLEMNEDYFNERHAEYMLDNFYDEIDYPFVSKEDLLPKVKELEKI